jgi:hypothetical protein
VKEPAEQTEPWDYLKLIATIPPGMASRPLAEGGCPLVKQVRLARQSSYSSPSAVSPR